jgi:Biotin-requiring enzyme
VVRPTAEALDQCTQHRNRSMGVGVSATFLSQIGPKSRSESFARRPNSGFGRSRPTRSRTSFRYLTLEAMKMETVLHAERDGVVAETLAKVGTQVDSKGLLFEIQAQC